MADDIPPTPVTSGQVPTYQASHPPRGDLHAAGTYPRPPPLHPHHGTPTGHATGHQGRAYQAILAAPSCRLPEPSGSNGFCNGVWTTSGGDFTWTQNTGPIGTCNTRPSSGPSEGPHMYIESSSPNHPNKIAYLTSADALYSEVNFWYHMHGADMGSLALEVMDSSGLWSQVWIWQEPDLRQDSDDAIWIPMQIVFFGSMRRVRFVGVTGASQTTDAAVAYVSLVKGCHPLGDASEGKGLGVFSNFCGPFGLDDGFGAMMQMPPLFFFAGRIPVDGRQSKTGRSLRPPPFFPFS